MTNENRWKQKILIPGCGLGRLALDTAARGYSCQVLQNEYAQKRTGFSGLIYGCAQGNEFSYYMLIVSNHMLNEVHTAQSIEICPFIEQVSNVKEIADSCRYWNLSRAQLSVA